MYSENIRLRVAQYVHRVMKSNISPSDLLNSASRVWKTAAICIPVLGQSGLSKMAFIAARLTFRPSDGEDRADINVLSFFNKDKSYPSGSHSTPECRIK